MVHKVKGLNPHEQRILDTVCDGGAYSIQELKLLFKRLGSLRYHQNQINPQKKRPRNWSTDHQAQSYVRNSLRKLVRDGWIKKVDEGTYQLTKSGKKWVENGVCITKSYKG